MIFNTVLSPAKQLIYRNDLVEAWKDESIGQAGLFALREFYPGDILYDFGASAVLHTPSYLTIQKDIDEHICLQPQFLEYINHSCFPNVFFDTTNGKVVCLRSILPGNELTYFYPSTEWAMAEPFQCQCGNNNCLQYIRGASYIPLEVLERYRLSDFIQQQLEKRNNF